MSWNWNIVWEILILAGGIVAVLVAVLYSRNKRVTYLSDAALAEMSRRLDELTLQVVELKLMVSHYQVGTATLRAQLIAAKIDPDWEPWGVQQVSEGEPLVQIYQLITEHFSLVEMDELAALAHIPAESYSGDERPSRALSLVQYAARHGKLDDLVANCRRKRPRVKWPMFSI